MPDTPRRVAIVKSAGRADAFAAAVARLGLVPVLVAPFRVEPVEGGEEALAAALAARPAWVAVTSPHAAPFLARHHRALRRSALAAVGSGTASALQSAGLNPRLVGDAGGDSLARRIAAAGLAPGAVVVHACAEEARDELRRALEAAGADVRAVPVYRMVHDPAGERAAQGEFAAVLVGSPRLAARAAELFPSRPKVVAVGRTTAAALRDLGWPPTAVAALPTPEDTAAALARIV